MREAIPLNDRHLGILATHDSGVGVNLRAPENRQLLLRGNAFAVLDDGEVFGAAGVAPLWTGCGHGWAILPHPTGSARLLWFTRQVRAYLERLIGFRRVQTTVSTEFTEGLAWATYLGFIPEGRMTAYDERGRDHIMFARIY